MFVCVLNSEKIHFKSMCVDVSMCVRVFVIQLTFYDSKFYMLNLMFCNNHIIQFFMVWTYDTYIITMHSTYMCCSINFTFTFFWYHIVNTFYSTTFITTQKTNSYIILKILNPIKSPNVIRYHMYIQIGSL